uniref:NADH dehydrogenase subunit 4L n=1 Tax=Didemnum vexillum TaxID=516032 RepID=A0A0A7LK32_9ASCI|nr:NADH dehydrogenase subunit 4L [Didemnum vexillum]AIZ58118.1 NADH dehydrogenase subunit 4L [Didemnum vexillum]UYK51622.1 NADH dehydrogenase subunit 4L [Didemnum vexillum]
MLMGMIFFFLMICFKKYDLFKIVIFMEIFLFMGLFLLMMNNMHFYYYMMILFFFIGEGVFMYCMFIVSNFFMNKKDFF